MSIVSRVKYRTSNSNNRDNKNQLNSLTTKK